MDGVITAIVSFIFVCIIFPKIVKNRPQFWASLLLVLIAFVFDNIARVTTAENSFRTFAAILNTFCVVGSILLLILSAGGLSVRDLASDIGKTIEVVRRGLVRRAKLYYLRGLTGKAARIKERRVGGRA